MSDFENRMKQAADEVRQSTQSMTPPPAPGTKPQVAPARRGWLVFAGAFAVVAITVGVLPLFDRGPGASMGSPDTTAPVAAPSTTVPTTPPTECSSTGVEPRGPRNGEELPEPVSLTAEAIIEAAATCDVDGLVGIAGDITTSFGGGDAELLREWEETGDGKLDILLKLFDTTWVWEEAPDGQVYYSWPAAFAYDNWDDISDEHMEELRAIYTDEELDQLSLMGMYAGWRVGITADGDWVYFVAGD